jgi:hypothetical protein
VGEVRTVAARLDALGGEPGEPINVEVTYVFAADERVPLPDTEVAATMYRARETAFPPCGGRSSAAASR